MTAEDTTKDAKEVTRQRVSAALTALGIEHCDELISEFKLLGAQDETSAVREIARLINERIDGYLKLLEDFLQPDAHIASLNEISFFTEAELEDVSQLYRAMMQLFRRYSRAALSATDEDASAYITTALQRWQEWKPRLHALLRKLEEGWASEQPLQTERSYFG